jgi:hypothetical protein
MPINKTRLSREEEARYLARAQELRSAQVKCEVPDEWQQNFHDLDIFVAAPAGNILCELSSGVTAYAIWAQLIALRSNLRLENCAIMSDWDSESIVLCQSERGLYRVGSACQFTEANVLNHRIENGLHFHHRGDIAEGWVVASGYTPIPEKYRDWMVTKLSLTFTDQFGHDYSAHAEAALQRSSCLKNSVSRVRKSPGLLEIGDPGNEIGFREAPASTLKRQPQGREGASINGDDSMTTADLSSDHGCPSVRAK